MFLLVEAKSLGICSAFYTAFTHPELLYYYNLLAFRSIKATIAAHIPDGAFRLFGYFVLCCYFIQLVQEMDNLHNLLRTTALKVPGKSAYLISKLNSAKEFICNSEVRFRAASLIKLPILWTFLEAVRNGSIDANTIINIDESIIVAGTGSLKSKEPGYKVTLKELALLMISESDNTATNILIDLLGIDSINLQIHELNMTSTILQRKMQDFNSAAKGLENYTTANDIGKFLRKVAEGINKKGSIPHSVYSHLKAQNLKNKLPFYVSSKVACAHKTGDLPKLEHDAGILVNGSAVVLVVALTDELTDNFAGVEYCREIGKIAGEWLDG